DDGGEEEKRCAEVSWVVFSSLVRAFSSFFGMALNKAVGVVGCGREGVPTLSLLGVELADEDCFNWRNMADMSERQVRCTMRGGGDEAFGRYGCMVVLRLGAFREGSKRR